MVGACSIHGRYDICKRNFSQNLEYLWHLCVDEWKYWNRYGRNRVSAPQIWILLVSVRLRSRSSGMSHHFGNDYIYFGMICCLHLQTSSCTMKIKVLLYYGYFAFHLRKSVQKHLGTTVRPRFSDPLYQRTVVSASKQHWPTATCRPGALRIVYFSLALFRYVYRHVFWILNVCIWTISQKYYAHLTEMGLPTHAGGARDN
jgi:hypothetical protein